MPTESQYRRAAEDFIASGLTGSNPDVSIGYSETRSHREYAEVRFYILNGKTPTGRVEVWIDNDQARKQPIEDVPDRD